MGDQGSHGHDEQGKRSDLDRFQEAFLQDAEGGLSFGLGVNSKMLLSTAAVYFDYAFRDFGRLKNVHNFSLGIKF